MAGDGLIRKKDEGTALWFLGALFDIKATGEDTGGALTAAEVTVGPGLIGAPPHTHEQDECAYVLEGEMTYHFGERTVQAPSGSFLFFPKGKVEWFENKTDKPAKALFIWASGIEKLFMEVGEPAKTRSLPPPPAGPPDMEKLTYVAKKYGVTILPPPH